MVSELTYLENLTCGNFYLEVQMHTKMYTTC